MTNQIIACSDIAITSRPPESNNYTEWIDYLSDDARQLLLTLSPNVLSKVRRFGDTWILRPSLAYNSNEFFYLTPFYSDGKLFSQISHFFNGESHRLFFNTTLVNSEGDNWPNDNFRVVSFTTKIDNNLLAWLEFNAARL